MAGNLDSSSDQSLMRIADKLAAISKNLETQNEILRVIAERLNAK